MAVEAQYRATPCMLRAGVQVSVSDRGSGIGERVLHL